MFFTRVVPRRDFAETLLLTPPEPVLARSWDGRAAGLDPLEAMAEADRADRSLLWLVAAAAAATLLMATLAAITRA
jgi:hypothetical protein